MVPKKKTVVTVEQPEETEPEPLPEAAPEPEPEEDDGEQLDPLEEVLAEVGDASTYTLYKIPNEYLRRGPVEELDGSLLQFVADNYGGGEYRVQFRRPKNQFGRTVRFKIASSVHAKPGGIAGPPVNEDRKELVELVRELINREEKKSSGFDMKEIMGPMITAAADMSRAIVENMKPQPQPAPPWELIVPLVQGAMELGAEVKKGDGEGGGYLPLVERFAGMIEKAMTRRQQPPAQVAPGQPDRVIVTPPPQTFTQAAGVNEPGWVKGLRPYLSQILSWAKDDVPPEMVIDALDSAAPAMLQWLAARDVEMWPGELAGYVPELAPHTAWIKKFLLALGEDEEPESDDEPQAHGV